MSVLSFGGYSVGDLYIYNGVHKIVAIQGEYVYDRFGQPHVAVQVDSGAVYWARPLI